MNGRSSRAVRSGCMPSLRRYHFLLVERGCQEKNRGIPLTGCVSEGSVRRMSPSVDVVPQAPGSFARTLREDPSEAVLRQAIRLGCVVLASVMARLKRETGQRGRAPCEELERLLTRAATLVENLRRLHAQVVPAPVAVVEPNPMLTVAATVTARSPVRLDGAERLLREATA